MSNRYWIGVDLSQKSFTAAVAGDTDRPEHWAKLPHKTFAFTDQGVSAFVAWVRRRVPEDALEGVCIESTGRLSGRLVADLDGRLGRPAIVNPCRPKRYGQSAGILEKTDRSDACVLALYGVALRPRSKPLPAQHLLMLRECNRAFGTVSQKHEADVKRLADGPQDPVVRKALQTQIRQQERTLQRLQARMDQLVKQDERLHEDQACMTSVIGIGTRTAQVLLAELGDLRTYSRNEIVGYASLYPVHTESGTSVHKRPQMAKRGGGRIRKALYLAAMSARQHNPQLRRFYERLLQNGKKPMQALGAVMRKLLLLARALVIKGQRYDPTYGMQAA